MRDETWGAIWGRALFFVALVALIGILSSCGGDPCFESDYTTSGLCVHLDGFDLDPDHVDFVVHKVSEVANRHGLNGVNMAQRLEEIGPVPLFMVPWNSLGTTADGTQIVGSTDYAVVVPWGNDRVSGYTIRIEDDEIEWKLLTTIHELLHILAAEYLGTSMETNIAHSEPYLFRKWSIDYDPTYPTWHTVEGIAWSYLTEYLIEEGLVEEKTP